MRVAGYERPRLDTGADANWLRGEVELDLEASGGSFQAGRGVSLGRLRPVGSSEVPGRSAYALALACLGVFSPFCGTRTVGRRGTIGECQDEKGYEGRKYAPPFSLVGSEGGVMGEEDRSADGSTLRGPRAVEGESGRSTGARRPLASLLAEAGVASEEQLRLAVAEGMGSGERLGEIVLRRGWIDEAGLGRLLARQWGLVYLDDEAAILEESVGTLLSAQEEELLGVCIIGFVEGVPLVAAAEPAEDRFARVRSALGRECEFAVVSKSTLERLLTQRASDEAEAQAARASAAAARAAEDDRAELLLGELDAAADTLVEWAQRLRRVVELHQQTEDELSACREQIVALRNEVESERATVDRLEKQLAHQRELVSAVKAKLTDAARALEAE